MFVAPAFVTDGDVEPPILPQNIQIAEISDSAVYQSTTLPKMCQESPKCLCSPPTVYNNSTLSNEHPNDTHNTPKAPTQSIDPVQAATMLLSMMAGPQVLNLPKPMDGIGNGLDDPQEALERPQSECSPTEPPHALFQLPSCQIKCIYCQQSPTPLYCPK